MNKLWKKFDVLTGKSYSNMVGAGEGFEVWNEAFAVLLDIISDGRGNDPDFARELVDLDDSTDFEHDVCGWTEDYLDELDMRQEYEKLIEVCKKLLALFQWKEDSPSDLYFRIASSLGCLGKNKEALEFCEDWYGKEPESIQAAAALIYARMGMKDLNGAEAVVKKYISQDTECSEDNDVIFIAAEILYKVKGDKKAEKRITKALEKYDRELEEYLNEIGADEDFNFEDIDDEELPFN